VTTPERSSTEILIAARVFIDSHLDIAQVTEICHPLGTQLIGNLLVRQLISS
jgi:hypothetical protein